MISADEARSILREAYLPPVIKEKALIECAGMVTAVDIHSTCNVPPFDNSAMDGYAFAFDAWKGDWLSVSGESAAGKPWPERVLPGQAVRIFTGAMIPEGTDTVVMQEKVKIENDQLQILDDKLNPGANIRKAGSQTKSGDLLLKSNTYLSAGSLGFLAGCGIASVQVFEKPRVTVIVTGDEIVVPGAVLNPGEVYECNSFALSGALSAIGISPEIAFCRDQPYEIEACIRKALLHCDVLLITGGVSVGDYDFVVPALKKSGVSQLFHGVKQKPAKPLFAGKTSCQLIFGLPGNPASVLTSYYVYVLPALLHLMGKHSDYSAGFLKHGFQRKPGLTQFLKARRNGIEVEILEGQESFRMDGFAFADCLIEIQEKVEELKACDQVKIIEFF